MKVGQSFRRGPSWILIPMAFFLTAGILINPAQGEQVSQVTFYVD